MSATVTACKFVGTISLGLLTVSSIATFLDTYITESSTNNTLLQGVSYTLSTQSLPSLLTLPSAKPAAYTLAQTTRLATLHIRTLSTLASVSLIAAFALSPARVRHPYLLWTGLVAAASGGLNLAMEQRLKQGVVEEDVDDVNGEEVERRAREQQWVEFVRCGVSGLGFAMSVLGLWGDGS
jgi:autophagy-related protein 33